MDTHAHTDTGVVVDLLFKLGNLGNDFLHKVRQDEVEAFSDKRGYLLSHNGNFILEGFGIVGPYLCSETILKRGNDSSSAGIIFWIGCSYDKYIKREGNFVPPNLYIPFFQKIKEPYLDFFMEVRQFVNGKDSPISSRNKSIVYGKLIRHISSFCHFYWINITNKVSDGYVRSCQFF